MISKSFVALFFLALTSVNAVVIAPSMLARQECGLPPISERAVEPTPVVGAKFRRGRILSIFESAAESAAESIVVSKAVSAIGSFVNSPEPTVVLARQECGLPPISLPPISERAVEPTPVVGAKFRRGRILSIFESVAESAAESIVVSKAVSAIGSFVNPPATITQSAVVPTPVIDSLLPKRGRIESIFKSAAESAAESIVVSKAVSVIGSFVDPPATTSAVAEPTPLVAPKFRRGRIESIFKSVAESAAESIVLSAAVSAIGSFVDPTTSAVAAVPTA